MAVLIKVECPNCLEIEKVFKFGRTERGQQRYICRGLKCKSKTFILDYHYQAYKAGVREKIVEMALNGSGIRDTARVLKVSRNTVLSELKKKKKK